MKTGDLAKLFGVSNTTIQDWTKRYEEFLSKKQGIQRAYDEDDAKVLATVAKLISDGYSHKIIHEKIEAGERVEHPGVANYGVDHRLVPAATVEQIIDSTELKVELETIRNEYHRLLDVLKEKDDVIQEQAQELRKLEREIGRLEGELNFRKELDKKG